MPAREEACHDLPGWAGAGRCEIRWGQQVAKLAMNVSSATDLPTLQSVALKPQGGDEGTERPPRPKTWGGRAFFPAQLTMTSKPTWKFFSSRGLHERTVWNQV